ncbi:hypothetical protein [Burkholderia plantarii]|uniref:hypothetical protein n=1 Tax=Burkholderia plantarii TaxID=41899 RepID=UPI001F5B2162|nr:hypothetical protein [Burkholderia plantarii]
MPDDLRLIWIALQSAVPGGNWDKAQWRCLRYLAAVRKLNAVVNFEVRGSVLLPQKGRWFFAFFAKPVGALQDLCDDVGIAKENFSNDLDGRGALRGFFQTCLSCCGGVPGGFFDCRFEFQLVILKVALEVLQDRFCR